LSPVGDASTESTEELAPSLTIVGVDTTFLSTIRMKRKSAFSRQEIFYRTF